MPRNPLQARLDTRYPRGIGTANGPQNGRCGPLCGLRVTAEFPACGGSAADPPLESGARRALCGHVLQG
jgi:hypothetical protein